MNSESVRIYLVAAMGANRVIGNGPNIPWKIPGEQKIFRRLTEGKVVVMGRKTFESIGKPLPNRHTLVISRQANYRATGCVVVSTLSHAIALASELGNELYVAGGAEIYTLALPHAHGVFLSEVHQTFEGDAFFPMLNETEFELVSTETIQAVIPYTHPFMRVETANHSVNGTPKCCAFWFPPAALRLSLRPTLAPLKPSFI